MQQKVLIVVLSVGIVSLGALLYVEKQQNQRLAEITPSEMLVPKPTAPSLAPPVVNDYLGLSEADAETLARSVGVQFRVIERDGQLAEMTRDYQPGRINAVITDGFVTSYSIEGANQQTNVAPSSTSTPSFRVDALLGMSQAEAEAYAAAHTVSLRVGSIDGQQIPQRMDYQPDRVTIAVSNDVVTNVSVE